jgi:hypothetical protein
VIEPRANYPKTGIFGELFVAFSGTKTKAKETGVATTFAAFVMIICGMKFCYENIR